MAKLLIAVLFSILLLPVGAQYVFATHPDLECPPPGILIPGPGNAFNSFIGTPFCFGGFLSSIVPTTCPPGYQPSSVLIPPTLIIPACLAPPQQTPDPTHPDQCEGASVLDNNNHCFADSNEQQVMCGEKTIQVGDLCFPDVFKVCGANTIPDEDVFMCFGQTMGMVGGILVDIDTMALLVANIGVNPILTGLVAITIAGVAGQAIWFVHRRKKKLDR